MRAGSTIPKLKLVVAVLSAQLAATVRRELRWSGKVVFHTDDQVVLKYILTSGNRSGCQSLWRTEINTNQQSWAYVNTKNNARARGDWKQRHLEIRVYG